MKTIIGTAATLLILAALGWIGSQDYEEDKKYESYHCEMINKGEWGAGKGLAQFCKDNY